MPETEPQFGISHFVLLKTGIESDIFSAPVLPPAEVLKCPLLLEYSSEGIMENEITTINSQ